MDDGECLPGISLTRMTSAPEPGKFSQIMSEFPRKLQSPYVNLSGNKFSHNRNQDDSKTSSPNAFPLPLPPPPPLVRL